MKKFDLELAKAGHLVCTLDGKPVRIICFDLKDTKYPIVAVVMNGSVETVNQYTNEGEYFGDGLESYNDLMMVSEVEESDIKDAIKYAIAASTPEDGILLNGVTESEAIAWLEKQGEQTSADKAEPKFKVGDWITDGVSKCQIRFIDDTQYWYSENCILGSVESVDKRYHLWTIQDAKDGDVLADKNNNIGLYRGEKGNFWDSYIYLGCDNYIYSFGGYHDIKNTKPAIKEQRDLLFKKMKEAGYEWDAEKKELKKIEQKLTWSDYDRDMLDNLIEDEFCPLDSEYISWFKSIKDRFQQQNK